MTWEPASGAVAYQVQWSKSEYPWRTAGSVPRPPRQPCSRLIPGVWWYRVRGINSSLRGNKLMTWSKLVPIEITQPTFSVTPTATAAKAKRG